MSSPRVEVHRCGSARTGLGPTVASPTAAPLVCAAGEGVGGERAQLVDLDLRVYAPLPEVVIVRVGGVVDRFTAPVVAQLVGKQLHRAPHVVVDLGGVTVVDPRGLAVLHTLRHQANAIGTEIHLAAAEHEAVRRALRITGLDQVFTVGPAVDGVIAGVRAAVVLAGTP